MGDLAVVLASGGLDSCVCVAEAARTHDLALLHVNYGQRTWRRELRAFGEIADHYGVPADRRLVTDLDHLRTIGGTSLIDTTLEVETGDPDPTRIPSTYVPFRNAHMLCIAASWAEVLGAGAVFIGAVEEDSSGYPDCRASFYRAFQSAIDEGTRPETRIQIRTPLIELDKASIVRRGTELAAPLHLTWSCYTGEDLACRQCESCRLRLRGFAAAGLRDPVPYASP
ncbi:7-cyano-7-deazaguanine synthase QueC [bacterium]|nr:7-cyano-7-deazaguanine synthase QueC [bacterium]